MPDPLKHFASLLRARRGYLGTIAPDGSPRTLPVCFTWAGDTVWTAIDGKPKKADTLQRLKSIQANPRVSFTVDRWDEDWSRLAWLQGVGRASVLPKGAETERVLAALRDKYHQYEKVPLEGPVIRIEVERWIGWEASDS